MKRLYSITCAAAAALTNDVILQKDVGAETILDVDSAQGFEP